MVGGSGVLGTELLLALTQRDVAVTVVDEQEPPQAIRDRLANFVPAPLNGPPVELPPGRVVLLTGSTEQRTRHPEALVLATAGLTARLLPQLAGRSVTLISSAAVYGRATGRLAEATNPDLPMTDDALRAWCAQAARLADTSEPDFRLARQLVDGAGNSWTYAQSKRAQELLLTELAEVAELTVLRLADVLEAGLVTGLAYRALSGRTLTVADVRRSFVSVQSVAGLVGDGLPPGLYNVAAAEALSLPELAELMRDEYGCQQPVLLEPAGPGDLDRDVDAGKLAGLIGPLPALPEQLRTFLRTVAGQGPQAQPPIEVVIPPRPERPELVASRQQAALWSGRIKHGNEWTDRLSQELAATLELPADRALLLTTSGTEALRLALRATVGPAQPGEVAVLPAFTFHATGEVLRQLGYRLRFCDVDPDTWTLDPAELGRLLAARPARVVVAVDALGNPCDYDALLAVCDRYATVLVADSAPALGAAYQGRPVGTQAAAHAFSMSFAKVVSAGGAGGAVVLPADSVKELAGAQNWLRSALLPELAAIVALDGVQQLSALADRRREVAAVYAELAARHDGLAAQQVTPGNRHAWVHWTLRVTDGDRDALARDLAARGIGTKPYYAPLLHQVDWQGWAEPGRLPVTEQLGEQVLALPMSSELTVAQAELVASAVDWHRCGR